MMLTVMNRRKLLLAFLACPILAAAPALSHEGHGVSHVKTSVALRKRRGRTLHLIVTFLNQGRDAVMLETVAVENAQVLNAVKTAVPAGALVEAPVSLRFRDDVPGIFTLMLDFGEHGKGPVTVTL
ncbi:hypothetical protein J7382_11240 [Shimia sp. R11_0]|uniref:hypothetical protein n=1 Tax=Shimia sp. R11_0 TaxID=2821096 RepID=UPI001ADC46DE|nr:hypothetical protein [Shimia sp. R11_0]MBO9478111.1 hypothetical protein [Shimia sp. R11_0]